MGHAWSGYRGESVNLQAFKDRLRTVVETEHGTKGSAGCIKCGEPFSDANVFTQEGWQETRISQVCEKCFDEMFGDEDEEVQP